MDTRFRLESRHRGLAHAQRPRPARPGPSVYTMTIDMSLTLNSYKLTLRCSKIKLNSFEIIGSCREQAYNEAALNERTRRERFQKFKNGDFDAEHKDRSGRPKIYEDAELEEYSSRTQKGLALTLEVTQQAVSHRLKS
ncbi:Mariner Mos1 transposase [Eumeta japonica]|uniref:Mariner Mos1 transposase n=1 Tax=Eumeta variegata TaxID=151549 RepID=A0A4C1YES8_EUMVA|nr:Mariner Mos1 transposase [Eumeta japonica]